MRKFVLISLLGGAVGLAACADESSSPGTAEPDTTIGDAGGGDAGVGDVGDTGGEDTGGEDTGGEDTSGEDTGGEDAGGEDTGGEDTGGEDTGGEDTGPACGDGTLDDGEDCDDGNTDDGDGCAADCTIEGPTCGDAMVEGDEACDDGNTDDGDGCAADCTVEPTFALTATVTLRGFPVGAVPVTFWSVTEGDEGEVLTEVATGTSDAVTGAVATADLLAGTYRVTASLMEYVFVPAEVEITDADADAEVMLISSSWPTEADAFGESSFEEPIAYAVGNALWPMTIYPDGDQDYFALELTAGTTYEIFTTNLNETGDTYIEQILDAEGDTGDESDDFLDYDSNVIFTPDEDGTYIFRVRQYDDPCDRVSYMFTAIELDDPDDDEYGAYHDCDNDDGDIYPDADEVEGNDVDENCDSFAVPDALPEAAVSDADDTRETATPITLSLDVSYEELIYSAPLFASFDGVSDDDLEDWYAFELPPYGRVGWNGLDLSPSESAFVEVYLGDEMEPADEFPASVTGRYIDNDSDTATTVYLRMTRPEEAEAHAVYAFQLIDLGTDADRDEYWSRMYYWQNPDLDDADPEVSFCGDDRGEGP